MAFHWFFIHPIIGFAGPIHIILSLIRTLNARELEKYMVEHSWVKEFPGSIMVCDAQGIIVEMNARAIQYYAKDGGEQLIGANVLDCHPEPSRTQLLGMMQNRQSNVYTIEKKGVRKLVYQVPWIEHDEYAGFIEMLLEIPADMPHFIRGG